MIPRTKQAVFPVVDAEGRYCGLFDLSAVRGFLFKQTMGQIIIATDLMVYNVSPVHPGTDLSAAMGQFARIQYEELPIVDPATSRVIGMLRRQDLIAEYDARLEALRSR